jgi:osmotically-inducible protein OsmY
MPGVIGVRNEIEVATPMIETAKLVDRIEYALQRAALIEADGVSLRVRDGAVVVAGEVTSWAEHDAVVAAVEAAPGVLAVHDELSVVEA